MSDRDLVITRIFDAPRHLVYRAFTDPDQLAQWFGPVGWSVPRDGVDVDNRPGGHQRFTMVNDADPAQTALVDAHFTELVENELIVAEEDMTAMTDFPGDLLHLRVEFHDEPGGRTRMILTHGPYPGDWATESSAGWNSSFTKLDRVLALVGGDR
ncbi:hypothetical protein GCM10010435_96620 [Winogradskya consettensis]|uniref:Activator of Hsp90 ATPase homologue 1/2-like C-terminal domain-containing protein n=1 Tax=Winogradskya consettensis TaxID=113560 RepID=A0A919T289_9ACTN|nr:SRPBCC domain-containing protein [Actinoplanes consettensis]GIM85035.1 hypothetical protein Aco04nite_94310 [Actinoplanes consettensis]